MTSMIARKPLAALAATLLIGAAACSRGASAPVDASLQQDLAAAGNANSAMVVTSPLELEGSKPQAAPVPKPKAIQKAPRTATPKAPVHVARAETPAPAPAPEPVQAPSTPAVDVQPAAPAPTAVVTQPAPAPQTAPAKAPAPQPHQGRYKTEAEIFQQMPWIRP